MCSRAMAMNKEIDFDRGIETVASTDAPVMVVDWERWEIIREVLPMRYFESPDNDKVPLLDAHSRFSVEKVIGSAREFRITETELLTKTFVSESETKIRQKIEEGHLDSVSIGYRTFRDFTVEVPRRAEVTIDGKKYRNDFEDDTPFVVRTKWLVRELSLVPIGANDAAKFRSVADYGTKQVMDKVAELQRQINELKKENKPVSGKSKALYERKLKRITADINNF